MQTSQEKRMKRRIILAAAFMFTIAAQALAEDDRNWDPYKLPDKAAAYAADQAAYNRAARDAQLARQEVNRARQSSMAAAQASPEYRRVINDASSVNQAYMALRKQVKADLAAGDTTYKELSVELSAVEGRIEAARYKKTAFEDFAALYRQKESITNRMRVIEEAALESAGANDLRRDWSNATQTAQAMKAQHSQAADASPDVLAATQKLALAQKRLDAAAVQLAGSRAAYDEADYQQGKVDDHYRHYATAGDWYGYYGYPYGHWGYGRTVTVVRR
jgi:chromosome segregation ATPase